MSNPFEALDISDDDEETFQKTTTVQKVKRTHQEKRIYKQQQDAAKVVSNAPVTTEPLPERIKENAKQIRDKRAPPTPITKKLGEGHYHDRRSGTGRVDRPRKEGGGWGGIGNVKDELNKDKYVKQTSEETKPAGEVAAEVEPVAEQKPEEPAALTLEQYYKNKGVEITNVYEKKTAAKKTDLNAEWIKKEKLTLLQSKEDLKLGERNSQNVVKFQDSRVGLDSNLESLGLFERKAAKEPERREYKPEQKGKGRKNNAVIREEDFPSL